LPLADSASESDQCRTLDFAAFDETFFAAFFAGRLEAAAVFLPPLLPAAFSYFPVLPSDFFNSGLLRSP